MADGARERHYNVRIRKITPKFDINEFLAAIFQRERSRFVAFTTTISVHAHSI